MKITQTSRDWFNKLTNNGTTMGNFTHIISICCPDDDTIKPINENHLIVKMWDVDKVLENQFRKYEPPSLVDCNYILCKVTEWVVEHGWDLNILIHCDAGISRSAAISLGVLWDLSSFFFSENIFDNDENTVLTVLKEYIKIRKDYCVSLVDTENGSNFLKYYVEGKNLMRGVKPNQAILRHYRKTLKYFPW